MKPYPPHKKMKCFCTIIFFARLILNDGANITLFTETISLCLSIQEIFSSSHVKINFEIEEIWASAILRCNSNREFEMGQARRCI